MPFITTVETATDGHTGHAPLRLRRPTLPAAVAAVGELAQRLGTTGRERIVHASVLEVDDAENVIRVVELGGCVPTQRVAPRG
ncbi:hypothetical protein J4G33_15425 [Actinotalea sp. BY-33]|uniref:Uncharacterized protein n=1 Tax=Actinotalea soli TaxID=2819234 RepID=A0A939LXS0_9CELL|nr:hypothetical protein [Actinotalea soli]MBO1753197.1 hypothetical protein [Actinotalea soli]